MGVCDKGIFLKKELPPAILPQITEKMLLKAL
jgi:hypothetical protein